MGFYPQLGFIKTRICRSMSVDRAKRVTGRLSVSPYYSQGGIHITRIVAFAYPFIAFR
jgi:hypothetical protein